MTTPNFFDDLAQKCAKAKFDAENLLRAEQASFKAALTEMWEKQRLSLAEETVRQRKGSMTVEFDTKDLNFREFKPNIDDFRDNLPDELAKATKNAKDAEQLNVYQVNPYGALHHGELPKFACQVVFEHATVTYLKEWRTKKDEQREAPAAKKPKLKPEPEVKKEPA